MKRRQSFILLGMTVLLATILCLQTTAYADLFDDVFACGDNYLEGLGNCNDALLCDGPGFLDEQERQVCRTLRGYCYNTVGVNYSSCLSGLGWEQPQMDKCGAAEEAKYACISGYSVCGGFEVEGCLSTYMSCMATSGIYDCE